MKHYTQEQQETILEMYAWEFLSRFADYCKERGYKITSSSGNSIEGNIDGVEFVLHQFKIDDTQHLRFSLRKQTISMFDNYIELNTKMVSLFGAIEFFRGMSYNSIKTYQLFIPWQDRCEYRILKRVR